MQKILYIKTLKREALYDITEEVKEFVSSSGVQTGIINVYGRGATCAIIIQENWDESVQYDLLNLLKKLIPAGVWQHDLEDGNGDAHLKSGILGPDVTIPIINGRMGLSRWQNIFFCEFDGPREKREIVLTIIKAS
ncbi:MAG: secondary thiamine-phosphate synthase enzyme YjbQ [Brevinematales bacterium]|nr:secondary thiamine-phosphate synthase enzyme YjbQ [Brevinematales bacterium]